MKLTEFMDELYKNRKDKDNIFGVGVSDAEFRAFIIDYLLGEDWYVTDPLGQTQINEIALYEILEKHSKRYRKECRGRKRGINMEIELLLKLVFCHLIGDYVLQSDYIATTKGENWYHLFVHCVLYCLPFYVVFRFTWQLMFIFLTHIFIDALKARYKVINYITDQVLHYMITLIYLVR